MQKKDLISIIVPCLNESESLPLFYKEVIKVLNGMPVNYEIILVDDGSKDDTLKIMKSLSSNDENVEYISFSRNFGKEAAMYAGLKNAKGAYVVYMDADMQDPPSLLPEMYEIVNNGEYDSVATRRADRKGESKIRSFFAKMFYKIINKISDAEIVDGARDFRLMNRKMVNAVLSICEYNRFTKGIFGWVGFKTYWLSFENVERVAGSTKWSFWGLFKYAIDGILNFSSVPLDIASLIGVLMTFVAFIYLLFIVIKYLLVGDPVQGFSTLICVMLIIGGIQLLSLGVIGQYLGKTYMETKNRPVYIVDETNIKTKE